MTVPRERDGREAVLFVLITPVLMFLSVCLEQADPQVPGKFAFLILLGPTLLVALTGNRTQGLLTSILCGLGCVVAGWWGRGLGLASLTTTTMSVPVMMGGALIAVGTLLTLRCDEAEQRIGNLDRAISSVVAAENLESLVPVMLNAAVSLVPEHASELYVWEPREQAFVPAGSHNSKQSQVAVPLFSGAAAGRSRLAPTLLDWKSVDLDLGRPTRCERRVPLASGEGEVFGFLQIRGKGELSNETVRLLHILAKFSGLSIKNVLLFERLRDQACRDGLTGLANYAAFHSELGTAIQNAANTGTSFSLVLMDLDEFKQVNDRYGHHTGSRMLQELAELWRRMLPPAAVLARYGGDEFACLLPFGNETEVLAYLDRFKRSLAENPIHVGSTQLAIQSSIGVALYPTHARAPDDLFHRADLALYSAKRQGGGVICTATAEGESIAEKSCGGADCGTATEVLVWRADTVAMSAPNKLDRETDRAQLPPVAASNTA